LPKHKVLILVDIQQLSLAAIKIEQAHQCE
jgi:hypothetical protein